jgi:hypothetical protein
MIQVIKKAAAVVDNSKTLLPTLLKFSKIKQMVLIDVISW